MEKYLAGLNKKSFSLPYNGGEIWCEHLDSLENKTELVYRKFQEDMKQFCRPSVSSFCAVNLAETNVSEKLLNDIITTFAGLTKPIRKIVFVGLNLRMKRHISKNCGSLPFAINCIDDFEKAKQWLL